MTGAVSMEILLGLAAAVEETGRQTLKVMGKRRVMGMR